MPITVRKARPEDAEGIYAVEQESFSVPWSLSSIQRELTHIELTMYYVLEDQGTIAGYAGLWHVLDEGQITNIALTFINEIRNAGYYAGIYINPDNIKQLDLDQLGDVDLWIANYSLENSYDGDYGMWQYTCYGKVNGIEGNVDLNSCYYDYPSFIKKLHKNKN